MALPTVDRLRDHWYPRPGWTPSSRYLTWHLLPDDAGDLHAVAERYREVLAGLPGLDVVPAPWLHLTVQGVGFADEVDAAQVADLVEATRRRLARVPAVELTFSPAAVHREGVLLAGEPAAPVAVLRTALRDALAEVRGAGAVAGDDDEPVWPHLSLAYACDDVPAAPAKAAVAAVRGEEVTARFDRVSLIELRREGRLYCWERVAAVPLGVDGALS